MSPKESRIALQTFTGKIDFCRFATSSPDQTQGHLHYKFNRWPLFHRYLGLKPLKEVLLNRRLFLSVEDHSLNRWTRHWLLCPFYTLFRRKVVLSIPIFVPLNDSAQSLLAQEVFSAQYNWCTQPLGRIQSGCLLWARPHFPSRSPAKRRRDACDWYSPRSRNTEMEANLFAT